jgi:hypothetical protein
MTNNLTKQDLILLKNISSDLEESFISSDDIRAHIVHFLFSKNRILLNRYLVMFYLENDIIRAKITALHKVIGGNNDK